MMEVYLSFALERAHFGRSTSR